MGERKILFVTYGAGHADIIARLVPCVSAHPQLSSSVLALTTAGTLFQARDIAFKRCVDYLPMSGYESALDIGARLSKGVWSKTSGIPYEDSCAYLGVSMLDLIAKYGGQEAEANYAKNGRKAFLPERFMARVLDYERPDIVITTCHVRMERAATLAAKRRGIISVLIDDLLGYAMLGERSIFVNKAKVASAEWPDHIFVLNDFVRHRHIEAGFPSERVHVTGQPVFSQWLEEFDRTRPLDSLEAIKNQGKKLVTYASPARRDVLYEHVRMMIEVSARHPDWHLCIKLHPSVSEDEFNAEINVLPGSITLLRDEDILPVVKASDVVVLFRSTVGMLCIFGGVPLVVADWTGEPEVMPYIASGAAWSVAASSDLEMAIVSALREGVKCTAGSKAEVFDIPLRAESRIVKALTELC